MAATLGNNLKAYLCETAGDITAAQDAVWLGCETSNTVNRAQDAVECSDKSTQWAKFLSAKRSGSFEVTVYADNDDPGQVIALQGLFVGGKVQFAVGVMGANDWADMEFGDCVVTAVSDTNDFGAVSSRQITLQATGPLTPYPEWPDEEEEDDS